MAKLSRFRVNSRAIRDGEWVPLDGDPADGEILTRGLTDDYEDAKARRQRTAAMTLAPPHTGDVSQLPLSVRRNINRECLIEFVLLDVRNVESEDGSGPLTLAGFIEMLRDPNFAPLVDVVFRAAMSVGERRAAEAKDAAGN